MPPLRIGLREQPVHRTVAFVAKVTKAGPLAAAKPVHAGMVGGGPPFHLAIDGARNHVVGTGFGLHRPRHLDRPQLEIALDLQQRCAGLGKHQVLAPVVAGKAPQAAHGPGRQAARAFPEVPPGALFEQGQAVARRTHPQPLAAATVGLDQYAVAAVVGRAKQGHGVPGAGGQCGARDAAFGGQPEGVHAVAALLELDAAHGFGGQAVAPVEDIDPLTAEAQQAGARGHPHLCFAFGVVRGHGRIHRFGGQFAGFGAPQPQLVAAQPHHAAAITHHPQ